MQSCRAATGQAATVILVRSRSYDGPLTEDCVVRIPTDGRTVTEIATDVIDAVGWSAAR